MESTRLSPSGGVEAQASAPRWRTASGSVAAAALVVLILCSGCSTNKDEASNNSGPIAPADAKAIQDKQVEAIKNNPAMSPEARAHALAAIEANRKGQY